MTVPIGPHQRAGRRRRRGKVAALFVAVAAVALLSSPPAEGPAAHPGPTPVPELTEGAGRDPPGLQDQPLRR